MWSMGIVTRLGKNVDVTTRFIVGLLLMLAIQILLSGTAVFLVRRWKQVDPAWSWPKTLWKFFLLLLIVNAFGLVPVVGRFAGAVAALIGLKRFSGLDVLSTFILLFCVGVCVLSCSYVLSRQLGVDLLGFGD
jgi:hypothetical protein